jgi:hypothetical protein
MSDSEENGAASMELLSVSVASRIPPFWKDIPKIWFAQFESIIAPQKVSKETKYDLVIGKLGREELMLVSDMLEGRDRDYDALKKRLLHCLQISSDEQFDKLMRDTQLGEQKPSQLYRRMAEMAKSSAVESATVKKLWLRRLPASVRNALVAHEESGMEELTSLADKIMINAKQCAIDALGDNSQDTDLRQEIKNMTQKFGQLNAEVSSIREQQTATRQADSGFRRFPPDFQPPRQKRLCRFHQQFGRFARNCQQPCAWQNREPSRTPAQRQRGGTSWTSRQGN